MCKFTSGAVFRRIVQVFYDKQTVSFVILFNHYRVFDFKMPTLCCVVGCHNNARSCQGKGIKFYSFPTKPWLVERRNKWILAVNRKKADGSLWEPNVHSKICSQHFIGNKKSDHPDSPAYNPTLFPAAYRRKEIKVGSLKRHERARARSSTSTTTATTETESLPLFQVSENESSGKRDVACQIRHGVSDNKTFVFEANHHNQDASTSAVIPDQFYFEKPTTSEASVGVECEALYRFLECQGFHGYSSVKSEQVLKDLTGVRQSVFNILLKFVSKRHIHKVSPENRLLLTLMKLKSGATYLMLSAIFSIHRSTVSRIFIKVLNILVAKTKNWVFWPSKEAVQNTMPDVFKHHYPKTRVIIDCTEVRTPAPKRVDNQVYMYSSYKHNPTVKVLVGIAPNGFISFVSSCYGGRAGDSYIINESGFLNLLEPDDVILADKGFPGIKIESGSLIVMPPFLHGGRFSKEEVEQTYNIAQVRVHIERSIQRVKVFRIMKNLSYDLFFHVDKIMHLCCVLTNLSTPIIATES